MDYEAQAQRFLTDYGLRLSIREGDGRCPPWESRGCSHGQHYRVTLRRKADKHTLQFDFWGSLSDMAIGEKPTAYDVLVCLGNDVTMPTDPDSVAEEIEVKPTQAIAIARFAARLQQYFSVDEQDALARIQ